jgi:hypothetical protein
LDLNEPDALALTVRDIFGVDTLREVRSVTFFPAWCP